MGTRFDSVTLFKKVTFCEFQAFVILGAALFCQHITDFFCPSETLAAAFVRGIMLVFRTDIVNGSCGTAVAGASRTEKLPV